MTKIEKVGAICFEIMVSGKPIELILEFIYLSFQKVMLEKELVCAIFENESDEKHLHIHPEIRRAGLLLLLKKRKSELYNSWKQRGK
jgi:hypothetical protein